MSRPPVRFDKLKTESSTLNRVQDNIKASIDSLIQSLKNIDEFDISLDQSFLLLSQSVDMLSASVGSYATVLQVSQAKSEAIGAFTTGSTTYTGLNSFNNNVEFNSGFGVDGSAIFNGLLNVSGNVVTIGNTTFGDTAVDVTTVRRLETVNNVGVQGSAVFAGLVNISGTVTSPSISSQISVAKFEAQGAVLTGSNSYTGLNVHTGQNSFSERVYLTRTSNNQGNALNVSGSSTVAGTQWIGADMLVTGSTKAAGGLSGSLQQLTNGNSYLVAGSNITIVSGSGASGQVTISAASGGSGADPGAQYVVLALTASLANERVLTAGQNIIMTDAGAGGAITVAQAQLFPFLTGSNVLSGQNSFSERTYFTRTSNNQGNAVNISGSSTTAGAAWFGAGIFVSGSSTELPGFSLNSTASVMTEPLWITDTTALASQGALNVSGSSKFAKTVSFAADTFHAGSAHFSGSIFGVSGRFLQASGSSGSAGTYSPASNVGRFIVEMCGGGGGGGGSVGTAVFSAAGGGGGGGGYAMIYVVVPSPGVTTYAYSIGAGGTAGNIGGGNGGAGGSTTFDAAGVNGGGAGIGSALANFGTGQNSSFRLGVLSDGGSGGSGIPVGGIQLKRQSGSPGFAGLCKTGSVAQGGGGGTSGAGFGSGVVAAALSTTTQVAGGAAPAGSGAGGGGSCSATATGALGGVGGSGFIVVYEFT
jgi:hypothetical protein